MAIESGDVWALLESRDQTIQAMREEITALRAVESERELVRRSLSELQQTQREMAADIYSLRAELFRSRTTGRRVVRRLTGPLARALRRARSIFRPRVGHLVQYAPKHTLSGALTHVIARQNAARISLVTPSYGQGDFIERTILSVLDQNYPNLEYWVQDGGSKDNTVQVLRSYEDRLAGWQSESDSGQSEAINRGFRRSTGDIMGWLNSDDLLLPGALATVDDYFARHPDVDVVYGNRLMIDEEDREIGRWIMPGHDSSALSWADYIPQETLFWRRRIWEKAGGQIDESFRFAMDWDLLVRFRDAGAKFAHIPRFMGAFRIHEQQKTSAVISEVGFQEMDRIRKRIHGYVPTQLQIRKAVAPFLLRHIAVDLKWRIKRAIKSTF